VPVIVVFDDISYDYTSLERPVTGSVGKKLVRRQLDLESRASECLLFLWGFLEAC
jgi:hypothetical protein